MATTVHSKYITFFVVVGTSGLEQHFNNVLTKQFQKEFKKGHGGVSIPPINIPVLIEDVSNEIRLKLENIFISHITENRWKRTAQSVLDFRKLVSKWSDGNKSTFSEKFDYTGPSSFTKMKSEIIKGDDPFETDRAILEIRTGTIADLVLDSLGIGAGITRILQREVPLTSEVIKNIFDFRWFVQMGELAREFSSKFGFKTFVQEVAHSAFLGTTTKSVSRRSTSRYYGNNKPVTIPGYRGGPKHSGIAKKYKPYFVSIARDTTMAVMNNVPIAFSRYVDVPARDVTPRPYLYLTTTEEDFIFDHITNYLRVKYQIS